MNQEQPASGQEFNLALLLNILWRQRLVVLGLPALGLAIGLLYGAFGTRRWEATVTIRPGITAFSPDGGPLRQWQLRDITNWFDRRLYEGDLAERLGMRPGSRQVIRAEFIAQGVQNPQGGDVITLWTTGTSPQQAAAILDTSLALFAGFAEADTVSSQIKLTRDGLLLQMRRLEVQLDGLIGEERRVALQLASARAESLQVVSEDQRLALDLDQLAKQLGFYQKRLEALRDEEPRLTSNLQQLEQAVQRLAQGAGTPAATDEIPSWVRRDAILDGGTVLESLTRAKLQVQQALHQNRAQQDSLLYAAEINRLEYTKLEIHRENTIRMRLSEAGSKIGKLLIERDVGLPGQRAEIQNSLEERKLKLALLAPVQRVGRTVVSDKPVRPRTLRAVLILAALGGAAGVGVGLTWDYLRTHRQEIFRS